MLRFERRTGDAIHSAAQARMAAGAGDWLAFSKSLARFLY
jgi:hypothetical protein